MPIATILVTASGFRSDRTGGQIVWKDLVDHWKLREHRLLSEDDRPTPRWMYRRPILHALWYLVAYGGFRHGIVVVDQGESQRLALLLRVLRKRRRVRILVVVHHLREAFRFRNRIYVRMASWNEAAVLRLAHRVVVHTRDAATHVAAKGVREDCIAVVPLGTRPADRPVSIRSLGEDEPLRLLWVGGDFARKGMDLLLEALKRTPGPRPRLTVAGQPLTEADMARTRSLAEHLGIGASVTFLGLVPPARLEHLWYDHDVYVLPSRHEGHGLALDEALVRGMPVAVSNLPVFLERLRPDEAYFFPPDDIDSLARALFELRDHELRRLFSQRGIARAKTFPTWGETLDRYEALLRQEIDALP